MSKFFTYEERLTIQKELRESHSLKSIARLLDKNPTTISREIKKYSSAARRMFVAGIVFENLLCTANYAKSVMHIVLILFLKSVWFGLNHRMCVMAVKT